MKSPSHSRSSSTRILKAPYWTSFLSLLTLIYTLHTSFCGVVGNARLLGHVRSVHVLDSLIYSPYAVMLNHTSVFGLPSPPALSHRKISHLYPFCSWERESISRASGFNSLSRGEYIPIALQGAKFSAQMKDEIWTFGLRKIAGILDSISRFFDWRTFKYRLQLGW